MNYPYGVHAAVVAIDRDTGITTVEKFLIAYDIGCAVNPMLVEGQLQGGLAQGIGGALFEEFNYDAAGQPLASTFADYIMPGSTEVPGAEILLAEDAPSPLNPLGVKGAGEGGINAVGAAIGQISGEVDHIFRDMDRDAFLAAAEQMAYEQAALAGAAPESLKVVDVETIPLAYLPGRSVRVRLRVVGDLPS